jgi:hypothetical protein
MPEFDLSTAQPVIDYSSENSRLLSDTRRMYPFINKHNVVITTNQKDKDTWGYAETWKPNETGWEGTKSQGYVTRPKTIPLEALGIDIYQRGGMNPNDIAGEVLHGDTYANETRDKLMSSLTDWQKEVFREQGDYKDTVAPDEIKLRNATDSAIRGSVLNQWPKEAIDELKLSPSQQKYLDDLKSYIQSGTVENLSPKFDLNTAVPVNNKDLNTSNPDNEGMQQ